MKRLLYKIRMWLLRLLYGESEECAEITKDAYMDYISEQRKQISMLVETIDAYMDYTREQRKQISMLVETIALYKNTIREICRRSENTYYDWCCDQCACNCDKRNGWCNDFEPVSYGK